MIKKNVFKSVRAKLFITLCIVILMIIFFFIVINNTVLETLYFHSKKEASLNVFNYINENLPKTAEEIKGYRAHAGHGGEGRLYRGRQFEQVGPLYRRDPRGRRP